MLNKRTTKLTLLALTLAFLALPLLAKGPGQGKKHKKPNILKILLKEKVAEKLDLTDQQRGDLQELAEKAKTDKKASREAMKVEMETLKGLIGTDNPDLGDIDDQIDKVHELKADNQKQDVRTMLKAKNLLTDDQLEQFEELRQQFKERRQERRDNKDQRREKRREHRQDSEEG